MLWFKHKAKTNQDLIKAVDIYGPSAYLIYYISCELYAEQFDKVIDELITTVDKSVNNLCISCVYVELSLFNLNNLTRSKRKQTISILDYFNDKKLIFSNLNGKFVNLFVPEVLENADEYTKKRFSEKDVKYPEIVRRLTRLYPVQEIE